MRDTWDRAQWERATMTMLLRCGAQCWWCLRPLGDSVARHHRQRRRVGGDRLSNLVLVHGGIPTNCHNLHQNSVHQNPAEAVERGFIVPSWADPIGYPIFVRNDWWRLDDAGSMLPSKQPS